MRIETSGPGAPPSAMVDSARSSLISSACTCRSTSAIFSLKRRIVVQLAAALRTPRLEAGTSAMPSRSLAEQELGAGPALVLLADAVGDRHLHVVEEHRRSRAWAPSSMMIGRTVMPGVFMSISRKEMPSCGLRLGDRCAPGRRSSRPSGRSVVQVFWPLTM